MSGTKPISAAGVGSPFSRASLAAEDLFLLTRPQRRRSDGRARAGRATSVIRPEGAGALVAAGGGFVPARCEHRLGRSTAWSGSLFPVSRLHGGGHLAAGVRDSTAQAGCVAGWRWTCPPLRRRHYITITRCIILRWSVAEGTTPAGGLRLRSAAGSGGAVWCISYLIVMPRRSCDRSPSFRSSEQLRGSILFIRTFRL